MKLTEEQVFHYYQTRLDAYRLRHSKGMEYRSRCPFHDGGNPSILLTHLDQGYFVCFGCEAKGKDVLAFEQLMQRKETGSVPQYDLVVRSIEQVLGEPLQKRVYPEVVTHHTPGMGWDRSRAQARYLYTDEMGKELFSVWRFVDRTGKKATPIDQPCHCSPDAVCEHGCEMGRRWDGKGVRRVLYRLPDVIQSLLVFAVEGEKNADDLSRAFARYIAKRKHVVFGQLTLDRIAVTTNSGGAMAWKKEFQYGRNFQSKVVIKLGDNDPQGRAHDAAFCEDVAKFAHELYTLALPVGEKQDISDYLQNNTIEDLLKLKPEPFVLPEMKPVLARTDTHGPRRLMVAPSELAGGTHANVDWLVDRLIAANSRGLVIAKPKTGKSLFFLDIAVALATNTSVLSLRPYGRPVRVGVISREDGPQIVRSRIDALCRGRGLRIEDTDKFLQVNTEAQSSSFMIDNPAHLNEMAEWIRAHGIEFCVIDVLNRIHNGKENSNDDMTTVMRAFDELRTRSGAQVCVIHHSNATGEGRGASAIDGWADYIFRIDKEESDEELKTLSVRTKLGGTVAPKQMRYWQSDDEMVSRIALVMERRAAA